MRAKTAWLVIAGMWIAGCGKASAPVAPQAPPPGSVPNPDYYGPDMGQPSWSRDGSRIAYTRWDRGEVWIYTLWGGNTYTMKGWSPSWSPDGDALAVSRSSGVYVVSLTNHSETQVATEEAHNVAWSPDGRLIAFETIPGIPHIFVVGPDGRGLACIATNAKEPCWSADGSKILHIRWTGQGWRPFTMTPDSMNVQQMNQEIHSYNDMAWSRDGKFIAWDDAQAAIYVMGTDGTNNHSIRANVHDPEWSPDGRQIACMLDRGDIFMTYLALMNADGSNPRYLVGHRSGTP